MKWHNIMELGVLSARPNKPRDKAKVEQMVGYIERQILSAVRNMVFYDLSETNNIIWNLAAKLNATRL